MKISPLALAKINARCPNPKCGLMFDIGQSEEYWCPWCRTKVIDPPDEPHKRRRRKGKR